jgi:NADPH-dependent ferric siderophore reductase
VDVIRRTALHHAVVSAVRELTPRMRRITLTASSFGATQPRPAQDVELVLLDETGRRVKRRYTIRHARAHAAEWDIDVVLHGHGPGARWGEKATVGDDVSLFGPRGRLVLTDADWHLFVGDESALPAISALVEALPPAQQAIALVEIEDEAEELPIDPDVQLRWLHRHGADPGRAELLADAIDQLRHPAGTGHAYLLGESRAVVALRHRIHDLGLTNEQIYLKGYWNLGRHPADRRGFQSPPGSNTLQSARLGL